MKTLSVKRFLLGTALAVAFLFDAIVGIFYGTQRVMVHAAAQEVTLTAQVSDVIAGKSNPEFTVMLKIENNTGKVGGVELVITPLDDNILLGDAEKNFVKGDTWSDVNAGAFIDGEKNIHIVGSDDAGITKSSFLHGGYKFTYSGTPSGAIKFNVALEAVCDDYGEDIGVKYNNQTLTTDYSTANLEVTPREVETTNTLSGLTLSVGGTQILSGTGDSQTVSEPIAYADKANVKISATREGAASKIKIAEGNKTLVNEQTENVTNASLGDLSVGEHTLTITVTSESGSEKVYTVKLTVAEEPAVTIVKPTSVASTTSAYTGSPIDFTPSGMAELVSSGKVKLYSVSASGAETAVGIDAFKLTGAGSCKIVARTTDGFVWDGDGSDAVYEFSVGKAVLSAKQAEAGKLPTFTSESYKGSLDNVIEYKYYSDAACTQEVAISALSPGTKYYAKPVLKGDTADNFEFDSGSVTQGYTNSGFEYEAPNPSGTPNPSDNKDGIGGLPLWAWIVIAAAVLLLILLVVLILLKNKKKKVLAEERRQREIVEERNRQERLEEERREEKRMEREERMMVMHQQAAAPPPPPQPQPPIMPIMSPMMSPMMNPMMNPMMQPPVQPTPPPQPAPQPIIQQLPAPQPMAGGASYELMRMAEEKARAEERARLAEERTLNMMQEQQLRAAYQQPALPQPAQANNSVTEERIRAAEERARKVEDKIARMEMEDRIREATAAAAVSAPQPAPAQTKDVSIKLTENAANALSNALSGIINGVAAQPVQPVVQPAVAPAQQAPAAPATELEFRRHFRG